MKLSVRPYPYPFRAAFSICNDLDLMTEERYLFLKDFFQNFPASAPSAKPGLPYGESFFVFNENPFHPEQISLLTHPRLLVPDLESGYLATMHGWGDFNFNPVFTREHAIKGLGLLKEIQKKTRVWVNHGSLHNLQNIGEGSGYGDVKEYIDGASKKYPVREYHLDLARQLGIEFFWISELTAIVGQNTKISPWRAWRESKRPSRSRKPSSPPSKKTLERAAYQALHLYRKDNSLLKPRIMRDGNQIMEFVRFGAHDLATADDLIYLIPAEVIEELLGNAGVMVLYTHLAKTKQPAGKMVDESVEALRQIKSRFDEGKLWVSSTDKLLDYESLKRSLSCELRDREIVITFEAELLPGAFLPAPERLTGMTFYCDPGNIDKVVYDNRQLPFKKNPEDFTGQKSLTLG